MPMGHKSNVAPLAASSDGSTQYACAIFAQTSFAQISRLSVRIYQFSISNVNPGSKNSKCINFVGIIVRK